MPKNFGFVSTRFAVTEGVTLEARKWARVLEAKGHDFFGFAGELDRQTTRSFLVPEAHFRHKPNQWINAYDSIDRLAFDSSLNRDDAICVNTIMQSRGLVKAFYT